MTPTEFINHYNLRQVFHFTSKSNLPSILDNGGIFSLRQLQSRNIQNVHFASSVESQDIDRHYDLDNYVRLAFQDNHPMQFIATREGRLPDPIFIPINISILHTEGIRIASGVAYAHGVSIYDLPTACNELDFDVLFTRTNWCNPAVQQRLRIARKYELLIPNVVACRYLPHKI